MKSIADLLVFATILFALIAGAIMLWYLARRPALTAATRLALLGGIFVFPILSAMSGNVAGYGTTQKRDFCGGCHVMVPYTDDAEDPKSTTLASQHARNELFGDRNCYRCHEDYAMFGAVTTKATGLLHLYYYVTEYRSVTAEDALGRMHLYKPYPNHNCTHCHSTRLPGFVELADHKGALEAIRAGKESCVSAGCHGPVHPFSKARRDEGARP